MSLKKEFKMNLSSTIINADDFGLNASVNKAILESFEKNYINSTTLMANMPGFEEAVHLAHANNLSKNIGAHLVLTEGDPLTEGIRSLDFLFARKPQSKKQLINSLLFLNNSNSRLVFEEFCAQIEKIKRSGIPITHIDTHHHTHEFYPILKIVSRIRKIYKIPTIRILNNLIELSPLSKKVYRSAINYYLKKTHANHSDLFGNQLEFLNKHKSNPDLFKERSVEIMVHPDYDSEGKLIDKLGKEKLNFNFSRIVNEVV